MKVRARCIVISAACLVFGCLYVFLIFRGVRVKERSKIWDMDLTLNFLNRIELYHSHDDEQVLREHDKHVHAQTNLCPYCGGRISFFPVAPSGSRILFYNSDYPVAAGRFYGCCTNAGERGAFRFQFDMESRPYRGIMTEDMVSWYFCTINSELSDTEFIQENEYRRRIGKPVLVNRTSKRIKRF